MSSNSGSVTPLLSQGHQAQQPRKGPHAPSCDHNKYPIHEVLKTLLHAPGPAEANDTTNQVKPLLRRSRVLELGAGTAEHAIYFTEQFHAEEIALWQTTDLASELPGMTLNLSEGNVEPSRCPLPKVLSFTDSEETWLSLNSEVADHHKQLRPPSWDIVFTANTFHIAPWEACLMCCAKLQHVVVPGGFFVIYGPFNYNGTYTSESNARFDLWLKANKSAQSAIRHFEQVDKAMTDGGFSLFADHPMPENNHCLVFRKK